MKMRLMIAACAAGLWVSAASGEDTQLSKSMESFSDSYKAMRKERDPTKGAALAREAQQLLVKAMAETPKMLKGMPDGPAKVKAAAEYRKMIGQAYVALCDLEGAYLDGKTDEVEKILGSLKEMKKSGHDKFMEEE